jgi:CRISPR-associated endoribonuclease Cas6
MLTNKSLVNYLPVVPMNTLKFTFEVKEGGTLNEYIGSGIRGYLGRKLKQAVCTVKNTSCSDCFYKSRCAYTQLFEPLRSNFTKQSQKLIKQNQIISPLVLSVDPIKTLSKRQSFSFNLSVIGDFPEKNKKLLVDCFKELVLFSKNNVIMSLSGVEQVQPLSLLNTDQALELIIKSPLSIKHKGKVLHHNNFDVPAMLNNLIRRIKTLSIFYGEELCADTEQNWRESIKNVEVAKQHLTQVKWYRYSFAQKKQIPMQGVKGSIILTGIGLVNLLPLLQLGEQLHIGKGSLMGLGQYKLSNTELN